MKSNVPTIRIRQVNDREVRADGDFVLHWMIAFRRTQWNYSLQRAVEWAKDLKKPLVILEALRSDESLRRGLNVYKGKVTNRLVAESLGLEYTPFEQINRA